ncbi:MAG: TIR domain-containing protein, partial [Proteobacteria bacterium]
MILSDSTARPFLVINVAWHPSFVEGQVIAESIYDHFRRDIYQNITGGSGINVVYRSLPAPGQQTPIKVDLHGGVTVATILLVDKSMAADTQWVAWVEELAGEIEELGFVARLIPLALDDSFKSMGIVEQAIRWDKWDQILGSERISKMMSSITYQLCRMVRFSLAKLENPLNEDEQIENYIQRVQVFLSHSKHDADGERIAKLIRKTLVEETGGGLESFFDVHDIPVGTRFDKIILFKVRVSAVIAIHTDSYSGREWCRREMIEAKKCNAPLIVAN